MMWNIAQVILLVSYFTTGITKRLVLEPIPLSPEKILIKELIRRYADVTVHGRPITNVSDPVNVQFGLGLIQMDLDEKARALQLSLWIKMVWQDAYLTWDPKDFSNITSVKLESSVMWMPDVMLYNTADTETLLRDTFTTVFNNGTVLWVPHQKLRSSCSIDVTNFPFDAQQCHMWFGSWTYTTRDLNLSMAFEKGMDLDTYSEDFKDSNQWEIVKLEAERKVLPSPDEDPNYAVLTFSLSLRRNVVFASYILTLPCVFLACLTLVVFWLPPDRPDRTALAMSTFSSFLLLLLILVEAAPPTASSVPMLGIYYCFNMVIIMLSIFLSSLVVNVCRMGEGCTPVPNWIRKITVDSPLKRLCFCEGLLPVSWILDKDFVPYGSRSDIEMDYRSSSLPLIQHSPMSSFSSTGYSRDNQQLIPSNGFQSARGSTNGNNLSPPDTIMPSFTPRLYPGQRCNENDESDVNTAGRNNNLSPDDAENILDSNDKHELKIQALRNIRQIKEMVLHLENRLNSCSQKEYEKHVIRRDWRKVSLILDRVFFILYLLLIVLSIITLFPRAKKE